MKTSTTTITASTERTQAVVEIQKSGAITLMVIGALIGVWSLGSLFAGMIISGGPVALAANFIKAVMG